MMNECKKNFERQHFFNGDYSSCLLTSVCIFLSYVAMRYDIFPDELYTMTLLLINNTE